ncbi:hypothetical protein E5A73_02665 [Sphingomonas gei]|uniref:Uncharacterized protein n=1 Tax=Sphingomonas gei TaxID=1395960 RepID=A0A4S1XIJ4_9SPHN|nr:hypothetical protein [Sphingomonas gei]TGX56031.1 hypothetical protein E5A73_02665 [Sphingomonas gei]
MADDADPESAILAANRAAVASLRDTAKWLVGGVTATAVGIFAGSSLTNLGSLDLQTHASRLGLAIAGVVVGFAGLALVLTKAIAVLTVESVDFPGLTEAKRGALKRTVDKLEKRYKGLLPGSAVDLAELRAKAEQHEKGTTDEDKAFMAEFLAFLPALMGEGSFLYVRYKFDALVWALYLGTPLALAGFGVYAWAANPPEDKPPPAKPPWLIINQP